MSRVANDRLIEIAYLYLNSTFCVSYGAEIAYVAVSANPYRRTNWQIAASTALEPFVKIQRIATNVSMRGLRHLAITSGLQNFLSVFRRNSHLRATFRRNSHLRATLMTRNLVRNSSMRRFTYQY
jgi:hypothetical protein